MASIKNMILYDKIVSTIEEALQAVPKSKKQYDTAGNDNKLLELINIKKYNAVVAGGAAMRWYQGNSVGAHDVDVFFPDEGSFGEMFNDFGKKNYPQTFSSDQAVTYNIYVDDTEYKVQLIKIRYFGNMDNIQELLKSFDITVTKVATDGNNWYLGDDFATDLKNKVLRFTHYTPKTLRRLIKYWAYGFQPDSSTITSITNDKSVTWVYENSIEDYGNEV